MIVMKPFESFINRCVIDISSSKYWVYVEFVCHEVKAALNILTTSNILCLFLLLTHSTLQNRLLEHFIGVSLRAWKQRFLMVIYKWWHLCFYKNRTLKIEYDIVSHTRHKSLPCSLHNFFYGDCKLVGAFKCMLYIFILNHMRNVLIGNIFKA